MTRAKCPPLRVTAQEMREAEAQRIKEAKAKHAAQMSIKKVNEMLRARREELCR